MLGDRVWVRCELDTTTESDTVTWGETTAVNERRERPLDLDERLRDDRSRASWRR